MGPRKKSSLGWRASKTNMKAVGSLDSNSEECTHAWLLPKQGREGGWALNRMQLVFLNQPSLYPSLSQQPSMAMFASQHSSMLGQGLPWSREGSSLRDKGGFEQHLSRVGAAITGVHTGNTSESAQVSDCSQCSHSPRPDPH